MKFLNGGRSRIELVHENRKRERKCCQKCRYIASLTLAERALGLGFDR